MRSPDGRLTLHFDPFYDRVAKTDFKILGSEGYTAPARFSIIFRKDMQGVADTSGWKFSRACANFRMNYGDIVRLARITTSSPRQAMKSIDLTDEQVLALRSILESDIAELRGEISHTDNKDFRDDLKHREELLKSILQSLAG